MSNFDGKVKSSSSRRRNLTFYERNAEIELFTLPSKLIFCDNQYPFKIFGLEFFDDFTFFNK